MTPVTIAIVNFNAGSHLERCLASLRAALDAVDWTAIVVDNGSTDSSADRISDVPGRIQVIRNGVNRGFGAAVNQAAQVHAAPLLWLLNPDCRVEPGAFEALRETLESHPTAAIAAPRLLNDDGMTQESARGDPTVLTGLFGRHGLLTRFFPDAAAARRNLRATRIVGAGVESAEVDWVGGACMLMRRDVFDRVRGFDERFFLYWEDADLCRRVRNLGYAVRYVPRARVVHSGGASSRFARKLAGRAFHRSAYLYYTTHTEPSPRHPARALVWIVLALRAWWRTTVLRA